MKMKTMIVILQILAISLLLPPGSNGLENVALRKKATQSDTTNNGPARLAVDGNWSPVYGQESCTHTSNRANPWWRVDLLKPHKIFSVTITNRKDCCADRINGAQIRIGNSLENNGNNNPLCSTVPSIGPGLSQTFKCSGPMEGRYVNVYIPRREYLTLCEVEVNGEEADDEKVALHKEATQSDTAHGGLASLAVDGNRNPDYGQKSCTHTSNRANPWWRVDLLKPHKIFSVTITNRKDCCADRINGAQIRIGNSLENNGNNNPLCSTVPSISPGLSQTFKCSGPMVGRYVNVYIPRKEYLTLCEVEVNGEEANKLPDNWKVALRKDATQSDTAHGGLASLAVDGNRNPDYGQKSCTHTSNRANPWWRVDLLKPHKIFSVTITNRKDCCASRINGAQIRIGNSLENDGNNNPLCSTVPSIGPGLSQTFKCSGPMEGRYVNVYIPRREYLTLCEVEVNGEEADDGKVALRKEATQSDTAHGGLASLAIDGNRSPVYGQKSCTHTSNTANPWWRLDMLKPHKIFSVTITNRKDCCADRINGAQIRIGNSLENNGNNNPLCSTVPSIGPGLSQTFKCSGPMEGRYLNVYIPRKEYLTLCEVEVNREEANELPDDEEEDQC